MTTSPRIIFSSVSSLDRLGHLEMSNELVSSFRRLFPECHIESYGLKLHDRFTASKSLSTSLDGGASTRFFAVEFKRSLIKKFGFIGTVLFFFYRLYAVSVYYSRLYSVVGPGDVLVDLEFEPIQSFFLHLFKRNRPFRSHVSVVHSFPNGHEQGLKRVYKLLTLWIIKRYVGQYSVVGAMTENDVAAALSSGIPEEKIVLVGWGLKCNGSSKAYKKPSVTARSHFLCAGVLRKDKQLDKVVRFFAKMNAPDFSLLIAGASINVDPCELAAIAAENQSSVSIQILPQYFEQGEFEALFRKSDIVVISHDPNFHSMSGPLLKAFELRKPIVCFSSNYIAQLVREFKAGVVLDVNEISSESTIEMLRSLKTIDYSIPDDFPYTWASIARRIAAKAGLIKTCADQTTP